MSDLATKATRKLVTAQNMEEAKAAAYANDPHRIGDSGTKRERRRDNLRMGAPFLR
jgi:hypothetical protein